ncbi:MAG: hypothetical protein EOR30_01855 [Mesorhizobium sp.]|uniref:hypothetical protein n=1 Tax=unclassified Mesorhizobium TaxID=325217 RepID=UPI000FCAC463|nr:MULTISPECIES: hypothetical protein [unclassified Mesorhizobium]RUV74677.1 hypothetical protein EOA78_08375 [Mesorhizobium sp. M5C.F.Cr.IN.023.01.1.1]RWF85998.1 MAG: hypothetical protein EOQ36_19790 [Mesorhizobium sp.]RWI42655.1 MAG: hypothetical protein EOR14_05970 [Mesorhizobium sp.]RWI53282.1 MAG: hypothetical protein EOR15_00575 [Mesorhizobium sp.]RWI60872.1 MAG: hypothetical protein EOR16_06065 [Mesorhizobium sp.]
MHKPRCPISFSHPSRLSSSPAWTTPEANASAPVALPSSQATGTAGAVPVTAPATNFGACNAGLSCIRTEDGTLIIIDRRTGRAVSGATREAAEAKLGRRW